MKVKCVSRGNNAYITRDKEYEVVGSHNNCYRIINDQGDVLDYMKGWFAIVDEDKLKETEKNPNVAVPPAHGGWSNNHYNFDYKLTPDDIKRGTVRIDPYFVARQWQLGQKDDSGILFHNLKTITRFGHKNSREREIVAMHAQIKRLAELEGVTLP